MNSAAFAAIVAISFRRNFSALIAGDTPARISSIAAPVSVHSISSASAMTKQLFQIGRALELRDALKRGRVLIVEVPPQYPDRSLAWIVARDLLSAQMSNSQVLPYVIEARDLHRPKHGIAALADPLVISFKDASEAQIVFVINEFDFQSRTQTLFLLEEVNAFPNAKFVVPTRNRSNIVAENEFARKMGALIAVLDDVSFVETSHFLQKNFEMTGPESEVVAVRLRETFSNYKLSVRPSYFAGIPAAALTAFLRANRRAELIELAVVG